MRNCESLHNLEDSSRFTIFFGPNDIEGCYFFGVSDIFLHWFWRLKGWKYEMMTSLPGISPPSASFLGSIRVIKGSARIDWRLDIDGGKSIPAKSWLSIGIWLGELAPKGLLMTSKEKNPSWGQVWETFSEKDSYWLDGKEAKVLFFLLQLSFFWLKSEEFHEFLDDPR